MPIVEQPLFADVPAVDLAPLVAASRIVRFLPGELVFAQGDDSDGLYLIAWGSVQVAARNAEGQTFLATLEAPALLGEMGVLDGEQRSATATAAEISTLYYLPAEEFLDLLERSSLVSMRLLATLTQRLRATNGRLLDLPTSRLGEDAADTPLPEAGPAAP